MDDAIVQSVFTFALGKQIYFDMCFALARSFLRHNNLSKVSFTIIADRPISHRPGDLSGIEWIEVPPGIYGKGFTPKLYLDRLAPSDRSLFIDADCLIVRSVDAAFEALAGRSVGVLGRLISAGEWFGDTAAIIEKIGIPAMPRFNGGIYYLERGPTCTAVYETARALLPRYDELGFVRLRGSENEEVLMSAALALHGVSPIPEDGTIMQTYMEAPGGLEIDTLKGSARLFNPRNHPRHYAWMPLEIMEPAIVHFCGWNATEHPYRTEIAALNYIGRGYSPWIARTLATIMHAAPAVIKNKVKSSFRPIYRLIFGVRPVSASARL